MDMNKIFFYVLFFQAIFNVEKSDQDFEILEEKIELLWTFFFFFLSYFELEGMI